MLRFIFLLFIFFLFVFFFLVIRTVVRIFRKGLFFIRKGGGSSPGESSRASFSSSRQIEEADYEVIESHLKNKEQDGV
jgi:hypothetical protein